MLIPDVMSGGKLYTNQAPILLPTMRWKVVHISSEKDIVGLRVYTSVVQRLSLTSVKSSSIPISHKKKRKRHHPIVLS